MKDNTQEVFAKNFQKLHGGTLENALGLARVFRIGEKQRTMTSLEFLEKNFLDEENYQLEGRNYDGDYIQSIDRDQVADIETSNIVMYYDEYIMTNLTTNVKTVFTKNEMLEFVKTW